MNIIAYDYTRKALYHPEKRDTLFEVGQDYSPVQLAIEASRLAYLRVESSTEEAGRLKDALARVGFHLLATLNDGATDAQGFIATRSADGVALLAFRGTQPDRIRDLLTNAQFWLVPWTETSGRVHGGFAKAARSLLPEIQQRLADAGIDHGKLIITGHSLGAALATLVASVIEPGWLVTLGSPRVGNGAFAATVKAATQLRLVDCCDIVTRLPPPLGGYTHVPPFTYVDRSGGIRDSPDQAFVLRDRWAATVAYVFKYMWRASAVRLRSLADHALVNYARGYFR